MEPLGASHHGLNTVWGEEASTWLSEHSWVERSPEAALLCHVFTLRFGSGLEGISEPWAALEVVLGLCMCVLLIHYGIQRAKAWSKKQQLLRRCLKQKRTDRTSNPDVSNWTKLYINSLKLFTESKRKRNTKNCFSV